MSQLRLWILLLAAVSFLAGGASGLVLAAELRPPERDRGAFADYRELLVARFDLSPERERGLRVILDRYQKDIEAVKSRQIDLIEDDLARLGLTCRQRIRDYVLPADRREEFSRLADGLATARTP